MAKLHSYYVLCPLIDQKSFLGVSQDQERENVIVTLGRNVVNKYRLSDQKQTSGWTSKDHITSLVIFDNDLGSYVGVFNNKTIKTWNNDTGSLEKLKKYKFPISILRLYPRENQSSLIIFTNGNCVALPYGLENRKALEGKSMIKNSETIVDIGCYSYNKQDCICYITKNMDEEYSILFCPLRNELGDMEKAKSTKVKIERTEDVLVVGKLICTADVPSVYVLWSDSKMTMYNLLTKTWNTVGSVPWVSCSSSVSLSWMGEKHLILFGSNMDQDGAIIVAYNISLGVGSCRYPMKMYSENAKLYCFDDRIILETSNHIGMLPYVVEISRSLSSLLGSHEVIQDEVVQIADWGSPSKELQFDLDAKQMLNLGIAERTTCATLVQCYLEKNRLDKAVAIINQLKDIPESVIVQIVGYILKQIKYDSVNVTDESEFCNFCINPQNAKHLNVLKTLFQIPFCDALLIPNLRKFLSLDHAVFLISYICQLLVNDNLNMDSDSESKLLDWCVLMMDSFYQQYLLSKDETVTYVLDKMLNIVKLFVDQLLQIDTVMPILNKLLWTKKIDEKEESLSYKIELMNI